MRPGPRIVKLNVDASFHEDSGEGAIGAVLRDYQGKFLAAMMKYLSHVSSVAMAVAIAMKEGLEFAIQRGCNRIVAESDSLETIEACKGDHVWHNDSSAIFADCIDKMAEIGSVSFSHCMREANSVADRLAKECFICKDNRS
jgi:ribonuclease HI